MRKARAPRQAKNVILGVVTGKRNIFTATEPPGAAIVGNRAGLRFLARKLLEAANARQQYWHCHLEPGLDLAAFSEELTIDNMNCWRSEMHPAWKLVKPKRGNTK